MFGLNVHAPEYLVFKSVLNLLEFFKNVSVFHSGKRLFNNGLESVDDALVDHGVEEVHFLRTVVKYLIDAELDHVFHQVHVVFQISEGNFRFAHPEFIGMLLGV